MERDYPDEYQEGPPKAHNVTNSAPEETSSDNEKSTRPAEEKGACIHSHNKLYQRIKVPPLGFNEKEPKFDDVCPVCLGAGLRYALREKFKHKDPAPNFSLAILDKHSFEVGQMWAGTWKLNAPFYNDPANREFKPDLGPFEKYNNPVIITAKNAETKKSVKGEKDTEGGKSSKITAKHYEKYRFDIVKEMNGEAYHGIIACLLTSTTSGVVPILLSLDQGASEDPNSKFTPATEEQKELVQAYIPSSLISSRRDNKKVPYELRSPEEKDSLKLPAKERRQKIKEANKVKETNPLPNRGAATRMIAKYFGQPHNNAQQGEIFKRLVDFLNYQPICDAVNRSLTGHSPLDDFTSPAYLAGFYMDEYIRITNQQALPDHKNHQRLPVVAILVRRTTGAKSAVAQDKRYMNHDNLVFTLKAISRAFDAQYGASGEHKASTSGASDATQPLHGAVILMGDIPNEHSKHQDSLAHLKTLLPSTLSLHSISSPFSPPPESNDDQHLQEKVNKLWKTFKSNTEYIPQEVKMWGFYMALKQRYGSHFGIVGWRSGSLDGAGFLGIPTFWYDNRPNIDEYWALQGHEGTRNKDPGSVVDEKKAKGEDKETSDDEKQLDLVKLFQDGQYLFRTKTTTGNTSYYKRLYELSPLERSLLEKEGEDFRQSERVEQLAVALHNFIIINVAYKWRRDPVNSADTINLNDKKNEEAHVHLALALQVFLLSDLGDDLKTPVWTRRLELMDSHELAAAFASARAGKPVSQKWPAQVHQTHHVAEESKLLTKMERKEPAKVERRQEPTVEERKKRSDDKEEVEE